MMLQHWHHLIAFGFIDQWWWAIVHWRGAYIPFQP